MVIQKFHPPIDSDSDIEEPNDILATNDPLENITSSTCNFCPYCCDILLRHINRSGVHLLCLSYRQKFPDLQAIVIEHCDLNSESM
jgi:hypothetical protein